MTDFTFFGSSRLSVIVLDELAKLGLVPRLVITTPDKPQGRKMVLTPNVVKTWAIEHNITVYDDAPKLLAEKLKDNVSEVFIVASYGRILPKELIELPPRKTLNIHPSLLPLYRGPSPLPSAMLDDAKKTGISIMRLDEQMDHGPLIAQKEIVIDEWPTYEDFEEMMAREGARLLASILPDWISGKLQEKPQDHALATFTKKITKEDGEIDCTANKYDIFRKIQAFHEWPQAYFFLVRDGRKIRVKITSASFKNGKLHVEKVIPEGSREMSFGDFAKGYNCPDIC